MQPAGQPRLRRAEGDRDLRTVRELAGRIWRAHYPAFLSSAQIEYMLAWMYDPAQLRADVDRGVVYELLERGDRAIGYCAYETLAAGELRLHKLYLEVSEHGRGLGSFALRHVEDEARRRGQDRVTLTVNRANEKAIRAYRRNGYAIREEVKKDIGGGYFMDDYVMEKRV